MYAAAKGKKCGPQHSSSFRSQDPQGLSKLCVKFWYHNIGSGAGALKVQKETPDGSRTITLAEIDGNQGRDWHGVHMMLLSSVSSDSLSSRVSDFFPCFHTSKNMM